MLLFKIAPLVLAAMFAAAPAAASAPAPLQPLVDATPPGGTLEPPAGIYAGPVVLRRPITIDGRGEVTVDGLGIGTVVLVQTDGAVLQNLTIRNSGSLHDQVDSGVQVRGNFNVVKDNRIIDCLFGVDLQQSNNNIVRRNFITSQGVDLGIRGDSIRLWYSMDNRVEANVIEHSRDMVVWYSKNNRITRNVVRNGRYGIHFMYADVNWVEDNQYYDNSVGVFLMYSNNVEVRRNLISRSQGASGLGIGFNETSGAVIENNDVVGNATGLYLDVSPWDTDNRNRIVGNRIAFNGKGILFHTDWHGNDIAGNDFVANFTQAVVRAGGTAARQDFAGNHWDSFEGFDRDGDGVGDTPFELHSYADRIWMDLPAAEFFRGSPVLELVDFLERLAPFSEPRLLLRDARPATRRVAEAKKGAMP